MPLDCSACSSRHTIASLLLFAALLLLLRALLLRAVTMLAAAALAAAALVSLLPLPLLLLLLLLAPVLLRPMTHGAFPIPHRRCLAVARLSRRRALNLRHRRLAVADAVVVAERYMITERVLTSLLFGLAAAAPVASSQPSQPCSRTSHSSSHSCTSHSSSHSCRVAFVVALCRDALVVALCHDALVIALCHDALFHTSTLLALFYTSTLLALCRTLLRPLFAASLPLCCLAWQGPCCYFYALALPYCVPHLCFSAAFSCTLLSLRCASTFVSVYLPWLRA
jgi:hypothetical protein